MIESSKMSLSRSPDLPPQIDITKISYLLEFGIKKTKQKEKEKTKNKKMKK